MLQPLITIIGPTAIGKSDLAVQVALHIEKKLNLKAEIISADSRQVYRYLNLGTGKITKEEMQGVTHHMLDIIDPGENYNVFAYAHEVQRILADIYARGAVPILCGGTGFYIDAVVYGNVGAKTPPNREFQDGLEIYTIPELLEKLNSLAKEKHRDISHVDIQNKRRIIRAIDILNQDGVFEKKNTTPLYNTLHIGLDTTTEKLQERIQRRLDLRIGQGMIEESKTLLHTETITHERMQTLGLEYKFISNFLRQLITLEEFKRTLFLASWHYAKRQRTWFKKYTDVHWFETDTIKENPEPVFELVDGFLTKPR